MATRHGDSGANAPGLPPAGSPFDLRRRPAPRRVEVQARPGAREPKVEALGENLYRVAVRERAHDGEANQAIEAALARHLGVPKTRVRIVAGARGRRKFLEVSG